MTVPGIEALQGSLYLRHPLFPESRCGQAIDDAREFFASPQAEKRRLAIENSPHFRGYSEMRNERDWREQIHFGREEEEAAHSQLRGPNLWPAGDTAWRARMLALMADLEQAGRDALGILARRAGLAGEALLPRDEAPYLLLKLIHYLEPPAGSSSARSGVAPHVDFSWLTLILQDAAGGLEARSPEGGWRAVPHVPGALVVQIGEILQSVTGNRLPATPHRVVTQPGRGSRFSLPFFLNPALDRWIVPAAEPEPAPPGAEHVHRVFAEPRRHPFRFGDEEWKRKGLGVWCARCVSASTTRA